MNGKTKRIVHRFVLVLAMFILHSSMALGAERLLPVFSPENISGKSIAVKLEIALSTHMPFDDERTGTLQQLLNHVNIGATIRQDGENSWMQGDILVDGSSAVSFVEEKTGLMSSVSFSFDSDKIYSSYEQQNLLTSLLGGDGVTDSISNDDSIFSALVQGYAEDLSGAIICYVEKSGIKPRTSSVDETIRAMGRAKKKQTYTIPAESAQDISQGLSLCSDNANISAWLGSLVFQGKQSVVFFRDSAGNVLQISYTGKCGISEDDVRNVTLRWRLRRDKKIRDDISLTSPAVQGSNKNTLTITRSLLETDGKPTLECEWSHKSTFDKKNYTDTGSISLSAKENSEGTKMEGKITLSDVMPESESTYKTELTPSLLISDDGSCIFASGDVGYKYYCGKKLLEDANISVEPYVPAMPVYDTLVEEIIFDELDEESQLSLKEKILSLATTAIIREIVEIPKEDTGFISDGIDDAAWENIVEKARQAGR